MRELRPREVKVTCIRSDREKVGKEFDPSLSGFQVSPRPPPHNHGSRGANQRENRAHFAHAYHDSHIGSACVFLPFWHNYYDLILTLLFLLELVRFVQAPSQFISTAQKREKERKNTVLKEDDLSPC